MTEPTRAAPAYVVAAAAVLCATGGLSAQEPSITLRSGVEGRRVMEQVFSAVGGREALRSVRSIETEETIRQTNGGQGLRPSTPGTVYGRRLVSIDVPGQRIAELRILDITGNQLWDVGRIFTPKAATEVYWSSRTQDTVPQTQARLGFSRRHFLPFLQGLERQPVMITRWLGPATVNGKLHDAVSVTDAGGGLYTLLVDRQTHLPSRVEVLMAGTAVGDTVDVLQFSDYRRVGPLLLPHRRIEKRVPDVEWEYRALRFEVDKPIADSVFTVPAGLTAAVPASSRMTSLGPDVYLVPGGYNSVFVVFDDYVLVLEGGGNSAQTQNAIARIREVAPGKPIRYVVATHFHNDHIAGLRSYIAEGATIVTTADSRAPIEALARARSRLAPDALDRAPRAPIIEVVDRERVFQDARHEVRLYQVGPSPHVDQILVAFLPKERVLFEGDLLDVPNGHPAAGGDDTADFAAKLRALGLTFDRLIPVHGEATTAVAVEQSLRRGQARARCPAGAERRAPCNVDAPTPQTTGGGFSVREIPTRPEGALAHPAIVIPAPSGPHRVGRMTLQRTGSFKARGALNAVLQLTAAERAKGVVAVSAGNHAQALAWAAATVGTECTAVMPQKASATKIAATKGYGGTVEIVGGEFIRAFERAEQIAAEGRAMVHPFADPRVAAGQGTVGLEILEQCKDLDVLVVPIGGGGLISGVATAIKASRPDVRIIGVEPEGAPTMRKSLDAGSPQTISGKTVADGLAAPTTAAANLDIVKRLVEDVALVSEEEILAALRDVLAYTKLVVEPAATVGVAALLSGKIRLDRGSRVVTIISGGNVDLELLKTLL